MPTHALLDRLARLQVDITRPSSEEAEEAVRTLLRYIGEDPAREGLQDTRSAS